MSAKPWEHEPDYFEFREFDLQCVMRRIPDLLMWCGYVGVGRDHPLYEVRYDAIVPATRNLTESNDVVNGVAPLDSLMEVHGGLTFSDRLQNWPDWFFGFDCAHMGDYVPGLHDRSLTPGLSHGLLDRWFMQCTYRTFEYVKAECVTLAEQIVNYGNDARRERAR